MTGLIIVTHRLTMRMGWGLRLLLKRDNGVRSPLGGMQVSTCVTGANSGAPVNIRSDRMDPILRRYTSVL